MYKGIFSKTFPTKIVGDNFSLIKQLGYSATQFNFASAGLSSLPEVIPEYCIEDIRCASKKYGIHIEAISGTFNMTHPNPEVIEKGMYSLETICAASQKLNCPLVTLCTGTFDTEDQWRFHPDNNTSEAWVLLTKSMEKALQIAEVYNVNLGIEPELANVINSAKKARRLIDEFKNQRLKIIFDPANLFERVTILEQHKIVSDAINLLGNDIAIAHAKDRNPDGSFATAGKGVLDYHWYLKALSKVGFDGCIVTHGLTAEEAKEVSIMLDKQLGAI